MSAAAPVPPSVDLRELRERVRVLERGDARSPAHVMSLGVAALDRRLAGGGLALGRVHEVIGEARSEVRDAAGIGFVAALASRLMQTDGSVLWCPRGANLHGGWLCARGLAQLGLDPRRIILAEARGDADRLWAMEEGLGCAGLVAVIAELGPSRAGGRARESVHCRRLQLVAEASGVTGILLRPDAGVETSMVGTPETRWRVTSVPGPEVGSVIGGEVREQDLENLMDWRPRWHAELLRARNGRPGEARLVWDSEFRVFRQLEPLTPKRPGVETFSRILPRFSSPPSRSVA